LQPHLPTTTTLLLMVAMVTSSTPTMAPRSRLVTLR
jgi:hypothetical protein